MERGEAGSRSVARSTFEKEGVQTFKGHSRDIKVQTFKGQLKTGYCDEKLFTVSHQPTH